MNFLVVNHPVSIQTACGTSQYRFTTQFTAEVGSGAGANSLSGQSFTVTNFSGSGSRQSGPDLGPVTLTNSGNLTGTLVSTNYQVSGGLGYHDNMNNNLIFNNIQMNGSTIGHAPPEGPPTLLFNGSATGQSSCGASFMWLDAQ
jgi:hypothetical protein